MINIENLEFSYHSQPILKIGQLNIENGEKVFIYGPSGYGKSTLLNIIAGVLNIQSGKLTVLDHDFSKMNISQRDQIRGEEIGYIFQNFNLIPYLNVLENVILPCRIHQKRAHGGNYMEMARNLLKQLGLADQIIKPVTSLSIGQQQRVAAARALIGGPKLLIADEPTSSLDEKNTEEFMKLLLERWEQDRFTLIFVSHDKRLEKFFDRTISLEELNEAHI